MLTPRIRPVSDEQGIYFIICEQMDVTAMLSLLYLIGHGSARLQQISALTTRVQLLQCALFEKLEQLTVCFEHTLELP